MSFHTFLESHYISTCEAQRGMASDLEMVEMVAKGRRDSSLVRRWMEEYNVFQGIEGKDRNSIANSFLDFVDAN